jgi:uncharacterized protein (TIGR03083 family)
MTTVAQPTAPRRAPPRTSTLDRPALMHLAAAEYLNFAAMLGTLKPDDWTKPTECPGWDVRAMASHVLGMAEMAASIRDGSRQMKLAKKRGGIFIDSLTALQTDERLDMTPAQIVDRLTKIGPRAARARRRAPSFIRNRRMPIPQLVGDTMEDWTIGYLVDTILTRDTWMHRIDISRAIGTPPALTKAHDGALLADVATEWAGRHGKPCQLNLTGDAGDTFTFGNGGPTLDLDAIEFVRTLSGREPGTELLAVPVPF